MSRLVPLALVLVIGACGSKTGLRVDEDAGSMDASVPSPVDAGRDAGLDAGTDAGLDADQCVPGVVPLVGSSVEVVFVVDRSGSMAAGFDGAAPPPGESRWEILERTMAMRLGVFNDDIAVGAKFFPSRSERPVDESCAVFAGLDLPIGPGQVPGVINQFMRWNPAGGTPVAPATDEALSALLARPERRNAAQFIVVATDGEPTCSPTATAETVDVISRAHEVHGIDVYVIGIASTPPQVELLDMLAVIGGRPRPPTEGSRFYDARDPSALDALLREIARDLTQCVFSVPIPPRVEDAIEVFVDGVATPRDLDRLEGWDWTSDFRGQLSLFGGACERAIMSRGAVRADITCAD